MGAYHKIRLAVLVYDFTARLQPQPPEVLRAPAIGNQTGTSGFNHFKQKEKNNIYFSFLEKKTVNSTENENQST